jgi:hypothetical protein
MWITNPSIDNFDWGTLPETKAQDYSQEAHTSSHHTHSMAHIVRTKKKNEPGKTPGSHKLWFTLSSGSSQELKFSAKLFNARLVFLVKLHLIFYRLVRVDHCAMIPPAEMEADGL